MVNVEPLDPLRCLGLLGYLRWLSLIKPPIKDSQTGRGGFVKRIVNDKVI